MVTFDDRLEDARRTRKLNLSYADLEEFPSACADHVRKNSMQIRELELSSNRLNELSGDLGAFRHLTVLRLKYNRFEALPRPLLELKFLEVLELSGNQISVVDAFVKDLTAVKELDLSGNLIGTLPESLCEMPSLEALHVEHNRIQELPLNLGSLKKLQKIDISTNVLRSLPKSIATMKRLQRINCANNLLVTVPSEMGFLRSLKEFNLRSNNLDAMFKAKVDEGLSRFLAFLREEHERERLAEIERQKPVGTQCGSYLEYRCKAEARKEEHNEKGATDNRCWTRTGHVLVQVENVLYVVGGVVTKTASVSDELFWISIDRMEWHKCLPTSGEKAPFRFNHRCLHDPERNRLVLFGGKSEHKKRHNDLHVFDLEQMTWTRIPPPCRAPSPRECASAIFWADQIVVFGGLGSAARLNDLWLLDLSSMAWSQPPISGSAPSPRQSSAICLVNTMQLLIHGGQNNFVLDDLYAFDLMVRHLSDPHRTKARQSKTWTALSAAGRAPPPRHSHEMCFHDGRVYLFGGFDELGASVHSIFRLDISSERPLTQQTLVWTEIESELDPNRGRTCVLSNGRIWLLQIGSRSLGTPTNDAIDKGLVHWDVFKTAKLEALNEKQLDAELLKPKNPKRLRVEHTISTCGKMPRSYTIQTPKERKLLRYVRRFEDTFFALYRHRRPLLLTPKNECGIEKFVCSFVRPTKLHYKELYELEGAIQFVADFVRYERLENPLHPPKFWTSPTSTLKWQAGDAFDMAVLLTSLLCGVGYDAYVCIGYAPEAIVFNDQKAVQHGVQSWRQLLASCEDSKSEETLPTSSTAEPVERYVAKKKKINFDEEEIEEDDDHALSPMSSREAANAVHKDAPNFEQKSRFVHAWVMVSTTNRKVAHRLMIEPATGRVYGPDDCPYEGVEFVFNDKNFWICKQMQSPDSDSRASPSDISYDFDSTEAWEPVLPEPAKHVRLNTRAGNATVLPQQHPTNPNSGATEKDASTTGAGAAVDVPSTWVFRLHVPQDVMNMRCPRGHKTTVYKNCTHEKFAFFGECARWDGLVDRLSYFADVERKQTCMVDNRYERRKDRLSRKCARLDGERTIELHESFLPGNPHSLKTLRRIEGERSVLTFYPDTRVDGLRFREELIGKKTIDHFANRTDRLTYRSVSYRPRLQPESGDASTADRENGFEIWKLTEKFSRDPSLSCDDDVAKRVFYLRADKIRVDFHFGDYRITQASRIFHKDGHSYVAQVDPNAPKPTAEALREEFHRLLTNEKNSFQIAKDMEKEMREILTDCQNQDLQVKLETPYQDAARAVSRLANDDDQETVSDDEYDYLKPFLPKTKTEAPLNKDQALAARERCLRSLKERLVERANVMQTRLNDENSALNKLTANYNRDKDQMTLEQMQDFEQKSTTAKFRIKVLQKRLKRHEGQALQRYLQLDRKLRQDGRLKAMLQQH